MYTNALYQVILSGMLDIIFEDSFGVMIWPQAGSADNWACVTGSPEAVALQA